MSALALQTDRRLPRSESDRWQEWDHFIESAPDSGFMQSSWWAEFRAMSGYRCFGVTIRDQGEIVGGAMVMKRFARDGRCFYLVCDGPLLPQDPEFAGDVFRSILSVIDRHRAAENGPVSHLRIEPRWSTAPVFANQFQRLANVGDRYSEPRDTIWIDLRPSMDEILAQMKPKGRYNVRVAQRHGVRVYEDASAAGLEQFLHLHKQTYARHRIAGYTEGYFRTLFSMMQVRRRISLFFAEHEGQPLAAALVVFFGKRATYFFGGSLAEKRNVMAPYALHLEIMHRAKARGCEHYDLWGVAPASMRGCAWDGISEFKRKFGGSEINLVPTLDRVYDAAAYDVFLQDARA